MGRVPVSSDTQNDILRLSKRRCCLCFGLHGDLQVKRGQIAHLDRDNANNDPDNLAFLCLQHHDEYDSRTSQSKGFREEEVKAYRKELYASVSCLAPDSEAECNSVPEPLPNLQIDFDGFTIGAIFLTPEGIWSTSYSPSAVKWIAMRMLVTNLPVPGTRIGIGKGVSVRVKFEHDTGLDAGCASPTAWLDEKRGYVDFKPGDAKEAIIAAQHSSEWYTVTNVRDESGFPSNTAAMSFRSAPWFSGKLHVGVIMNGEVIEKHYSWQTQMTVESGIPRAGFPHVRPLP